MPEPSEMGLSTLVQRLKLEDKIRLLTGRDSWSLHPLPTIGLRSIVVSDGPSGVRGDVWDERSPSVNFPSPTALAASWDRTLVRDVGRALGSEANGGRMSTSSSPRLSICTDAVRRPALRGLQ